MQIIPIQPIASQIIPVVLNNQQTQLNIRQQSTGLFMDVLLNNALVIGGVYCANRNLIVLSQYLGYSGDFIFVDISSSVAAVTNGEININVTLGTDPYYTGLGTQFLLYYLSAPDLAFFYMNLST